ncbi:uncharacterized protein DUF547 [Lacinutrix venerupis]|uniref:DUF547 domain-containing protein n=1 Tax=Lacinutrix venerupis TaxID=1486034 RepID=UPI000EABE593|nr:DUF547 domain-containing protein [Lacinutrix venerupis]RLJ61555.1 uncharacterized protein DUF547 [Lacinutrix venerupis]
MKKLLFLACTALILNSCFSAKGLPVKTVDNTAKTTQAKNTTATQTIDHSQFDALLKKYVAKNGDVDYKGFKKDSDKLNSYVSYLEHQIPSKNWSVETQLAYFINVYNANTIKLIIDNYPTESIKDINKPWLENRFKIGENEFSLAGLENGILRKMNEPRIHFAINCASASCPKLLDVAYTEANVMQLMERATKEFINNNSKNEIASDKIKISEIFKWYKGDFTTNGSVIDYINKYSDTKINANTNLDYLDYDWSLNEQN